MPVAYFLNLCLSNKSSGHQRKRFTAIINIISNFLSLSSIFPSLTITAFLTLSILRHYPISQLFCLSQALADIHTQTHIHGHIYAHTHTQTHIHGHIYAHTHTHTQTCSYIHANTHIHACTRKLAHRHTCPCLHALSLTHRLSIFGSWKMESVFSVSLHQLLFFPSDPFVCLGSCLSCF